VVLARHHKTPAVFIPTHRTIRRMAAASTVRCQQGVAATGSEGSAGCPSSQSSILVHTLAYGYKEADPIMVSVVSAALGCGCLVSQLSAVRPQQSPQHVSSPAGITTTSARHFVRIYSMWTWRPTCRPREMAILTFSLAGQRRC
jgi:hypothetical protein